MKTRLNVTVGRCVHRLSAATTHDCLCPDSPSLATLCLFVCCCSAVTFLKGFLISRLRGGQCDHIDRYYSPWNTPWHGIDGSTELSSAQLTEWVEWLTGWQTFTVGLLWLTA